MPVRGATTRHTSLVGEHGVESHVFLAEAEVSRLANVIAKDRGVLRLVNKVSLLPKDLFLLQVAHDLQKGECDQRFCVVNSMDGRGPPGPAIDHSLLYIRCILYCEAGSGHGAE
jgi:hypothetical protein